MSIITNLCTNPSFETGTTGWEAVGGTLTRDNAFPMEGRIGLYDAQLTANGSSTALLCRTLTPASTRFPVTAGQWVGLRLWFAVFNAATAVRLEIYWYNAAGALLSSSQSFYKAAQFYAGGFHQLIAQAPATATTYYVQLRASSGTAANLPSGERVWFDQVLLVAGAAEADVARLLSAGYRDGDSDGWAWTGTAHASTSRGPSKQYSPDAELTGPSGFHAWLDMVPEFVSVSTSRTVVQLPQQTHPVPYVVGRNAGPRTGTLRTHFVRELADGTPGERSAAFEDHLRTGSTPRTLTWAAEVGGLETFQFIPTGRIVRRLEHASIGRKRLAVWTVECEYTEATA